MRIVNRLRCYRERMNDGFDRFPRSQVDQSSCRLEEHRIRARHTTDAAGQPTIMNVLLRTRPNSASNSQGTSSMNVATVCGLPRFCARARTTGHKADHEGGGRTRMPYCRGV